MPYPLIVPSYASKRIRQFIRKGGALLIEGEADAYTTLGFYRYPGKDRSFAYSLGIEYVGRRRILKDLFVLTYGDQSFSLSPADFLTPLKTSEKKLGSTELAVDDQNNVLALRNVIGKGNVVSVGAFLGQKYNEKRYEDFERFLKIFIKRNEGLPNLEITPQDSIQWRTGLSGNTRLIFIVNSNGGRRLTIRAPQDFFNGCGSIKNLGTNSKHQLKEEGKLKSTSIQVEEESYAALACI